MPVAKEKEVKHELKYEWDLYVHKSLRLFVNDEEYILLDPDNDITMLFTVSESTVKVSHQGYRVSYIVKRNGIIEVDYTPDEEENEFSAIGEFPVVDEQE